MAQDFIINVGNSFSADRLVEALTELYRSKGYSVSILKLSSGCIISLEKGLGGANKILGLGTGVKVNLTVNNGVLSVSFAEAEWASKIIAVTLGALFSALVFPLAFVVTGVIGISNQLTLNKSISSDINVILPSVKGE